ncbi:Flagellar basal body-associated protein FliL [Candidatus Magnetoovum chiemensis]|nr:Flagellar basal body-associated protein FliL [Candidatus Magnetoovum chiemensis]
MFGFKKKEKNLEKEKSSAKSKKTVAESPKVIKKEDVPAKKSFFKRIFSLKFMIIFLIIIVILAGAGFAGWYFVIKKRIAEKAKLEESLKKESGKVDKNGKPILPPGPDFPDIVDLEKFEKVKIQESESLSYLTLKLSIEINKPEMRKEIEVNTEKLRQVIESEIRKTSWLILRTSEGKLNFKYRLIQELNKALSSKIIKNVYFTTFILQ